MLADGTSLMGASGKEGLFAASLAGRRNFARRVSIGATQFRELDWTERFSGVSIK